MMQQNRGPFNRTQRQKPLFMRVILIIYLNQSIVPFYQTYENHLEKF